MSDEIQVVAENQPSLPFSSSPRPGSKFRAFLIVLAVIFAAATVVYSFAWMYYIRWQTRVELGIEIKDALPKGIEITKVQANSPAEQAGLKAQDLIVAVNGQDLATADPTFVRATWLKGKPGDDIRLAINRSGEPEPLQVRAIFGATTDIPSTPKWIAQQILGSYPIAFLVVGLAVLFMRIEDCNAWLLAFLFAGFIAVSNFPDAFVTAQGAMRSFLLGYRSIFVGLIAPLFYFFFAVFPTRSPLDVRLPWLKWALLLIGISISLSGVRIGDPRPLAPLAGLIGANAALKAMRIYIYGTIFLGLFSLGWNSLRAPTAEAKRKIHVILWGTLIGITPATFIKLFEDVWQYHPPFWLDFLNICLVLVFPMCFAYAVVKHRVMEIPALLRHSARYVLVRRGFALLIVLLAASVNLIFAIAFSKLFQMHPRIAMSAGTSFGLILAWVSAPGLRQATARIDRAFFRGSYDARIILQDLAQKVRSINSKEELAVLLQQHLNLALHPSSLVIYLKSVAGFLEAQGEVPQALRAIPAESPGLADLALRGQPLEVNPDTARLPLIATLLPLRPECVVPVLGRSAELMGLLVLGPRLSEEPYSKEDELLLGSVASQAGVALENIRLAQEMAGRIESDRRAAQEMQIARDVQSKLLPQEMPPLQTLDYSGACVQARAVGGDYYDFLDIGSGKVGFVLADIAGKGISGALLMANLQANLRSQYAVAHRGLSQLLSSVNRLFFRNTESSHYATMFFGLYEDATRCLRYANCGHNPPLLVRADGSVERLHSTVTVLGLFEQWDCVVAEVQLEPGDILAIYTDGITEAANHAEEEFGEERLLQVLQANRSLPVSELLQRVLASVQEFSPGEQADDLTLIIGRVR
jgi:sigma-B regulation protein RsbU (phosphoserine phosphatase)